MDPERFFLALAAADEDEGETEQVPARLQSRIYSALVSQQAAAGSLLSLLETKTAGHGLCIFEQALASAPVGQRAKAMNPCRVCHARLLAEHLDRAPIYWPSCPYAEFHRR